jgi:glycogen debranching enzyme
MSADTMISVLDGSTFVVSDRSGDIDASPSAPSGLFYRDTRFLSRFVLTFEGQPLAVLSTDRPHYFFAKFFLIPPAAGPYDQPRLSIVRERRVGDGVREDLTLLNHANESIEAVMRLEIAADFASIFEIKDNQQKQRRLTSSVRENTLVLRYERDDFLRETHVTVESDDAVTLDQQGVTLHFHLPAHGSQHAGVAVVPHSGDDTTQQPKYARPASTPKPNMPCSLERWIADAPTLTCESDTLRHAYLKTLTDLAALRFYPDIVEHGSLPAAGLPWFMALFGRDSIITSYQALPFQPELAQTTLRVLAARQSTQDDPFRDQEPGKILHELRFGELVHFHERPQSPYYGAADTTPLFLILLDEYERWTGDAQLIRQLEPNARAALMWIDQYGDRDGDGYVEYQRRNEVSGLENQCWKDSPASIVHPDGTLAKLPRATCEIQGYVYDAKLRSARLAREHWNDTTLADDLEASAARLRDAFNRDFWIADQAYVALALDGDKQQVATIASNAGQLLWSGILTDDHAAAVAERVMRSDLFSGWGIRTLADGQAPYNPIQYHNGTVWPHDNALIATGLRHYGHDEAARTIIVALLDAAAHFEHRLPEVFAGFDRHFTGFPVEYPTACRPQAWASGTPLALIRVALGLEPQGDSLSHDPLAETRELGAIQLDGIAGRWQRD